MTDTATGVPEGILREAYETGVEWAIEREYVRDGHIKPSEAVSPGFDEWLQQVKDRLVA